MERELTDMIVARLHEAKESLTKDFALERSIKTARYFVVDNLLPAEIANQIYASFPNPKQMHVLRSAGKIKLKYTHLTDAAALLQDINSAIQNPSVVAAIEEITGVKNQIPDPTRHAGGISTLLKGYYINPHLDISHDAENKRYYRTMNVLYYASPNWQEKNGGNYELWDEAIEHHVLVPSLFNRLVVMETNSTAWHAVSPVVSNEPRCCIFNYFFSEQSPEDKPYFLDTAVFKPRPEQKIRRAIGSLKDKFSRQSK